jgi:hypothetical protein
MFLPKKADRTFAVRRRLLCGLFRLRFFGPDQIPYQVVETAKSIGAVDIFERTALPCPTHVRAAGRF